MPSPSCPSLSSVCPLLILTVLVLLQLFHLPPSSLAQFPSSPRAEHCDQFSDDPICQPISARQQHQSSPKLAQNCQHEDLWLIPGKADSSCTRPNPKRLAEVNARQIKILPPIVKLPGCFTIEIQNVRILEGGKVGGNIFAKTEYQWLNAVDSKSGDSKCQNASLNGCGGFGNNCYYCDICKTLRSIDETPDKSNLPPDIAKQFKGMNCPDKIGLYSFRKEFCFNDWSILDANRDCRLDFLESISPSAESDQIGNVQSAMAALQQVGYGTLVAKVRLAYNATPEIEAKRAQKEAQIERTVKKELERKRTEWSSSKEGDDFANFTQWAIEQRKGNWHKSEYLPWLLYGECRNKRK